VENGGKVKGGKQKETEGEQKEVLDLQKCLLALLITEPTSLKGTASQWQLFCVVCFDAWLSRLVSKSVFMPYSSQPMLT